MDVSRLIPSNTIEEAKIKNQLCETVGGFKLLYLWKTPYRDNEYDFLCPDGSILGIPYNSCQWLMFI